MNDLSNADQDYQLLREQVSSAQIASLANDTTPEASYAPFVFIEGDYYLYLSELANHTGNLMRNPAISLMLIEAEAEASNPFARRRINLQGSAQIVARDSDLFSTVLAEFRSRFGAVMKMIEPLPDFHLFRVQVQRGRFVRGFGQAYELAGDNLDELTHIDPRQ